LTPSQRILRSLTLAVRLGSSTRSQRRFD